MYCYLYYVVKETCGRIEGFSLSNDVENGTQIPAAFFGNFEETPSKFLATRTLPLV